jgi:hypothetical protein
LRSFLKHRVFLVVTATLLLGAVPNWAAGTHGFTTNPNPPAAQTATSAVPRGCGPETMTQLTAPTLVEPGTSIACADTASGTTTENSWARCFNVTQDITVNCVDFGVESSDVEVEISIDIYRDTDGACPPDLATADLLGSVPVVIPAGTSATILTADFNSIGGVYVPAGSKMIIDVNVPDLTGVGAFYVGANNNGETADSYLRSTSCSVPDWVAIDTVWADPVHVVINVDYMIGAPEPGACCQETGDCTPDLLPTDCAMIGGTWLGSGTTCEPNPCEQPPVGACCTETSCSEVDVFDCGNLGGTWLGADTTCGDDCDGDGASDTCEFALGLAEDCNHNGIPDNCDIASGYSCDENGNGIPDDCEFTQRGDLNCDGLSNTFDIDPFVLALTAPDLYAAQYPCCNYMNADANFDGLVNTFDIDAFVTILTGGPPIIHPLDLAGNSLTIYPYFEYVRAFNVNAPIKLAIDPSHYVYILGRTADVYVVEKKTAAEWETDPALVDVTAGGATSVTFGGSTIQANTFEIVGPNELNASVYQAVTGAFTGVGHGYDMVVDLNRNGVLDGGDFIDGLGREAGLYVCHDTTQPGPLAVTELLYNVGTLYGITSGFGGEDIYYPTNIASMGELPLMIISHGNGHNYQWYDHIGNHMASYGYVVMSHQNNTGPGSLQASLTTCGHTDAFIQLLPSIAGGALVGHVDLHRIIWCGHSRGAEGVAIAFDRITDVPPTYTPAHYTPDDIILVDSMLPVDFNGFSTANPHYANYHLWTASGDADVSGAAGSDIGQTFHLHERATRYRQSTIVQGTGHAWFHDAGGTSYFEGPCPINEAGTHLVQLGLMLPMYKHYVEGNVPGQDFIWRQWEHFHPIGVPIPTNPCYVVSNEYRNGNEDGIAFIDDYETQTGTGVSSSGGTVTFNVTNLTEGRLDDNNSSFAWSAGDPFNGATQDAASDNFKGVVFDWNGADKYYEWQVVSALQDFSAWKYLGVRGAQGTQHPYTMTTNGILTFGITLRDAAGHTSTINTGAYGGGFGMPYARQGGWHNEMRRIRIRMTDFLTNGSLLNLTQISAVRLDLGPSWGTPQGRIVIDEMMLDNDLAPFFVPFTMVAITEAPEFLPPHVTTSLDVSISEGDDTLVAGSALLYYRYDGGAWNSVPLQQISGELWRGTLPAPLCGQTPQYYFSAEGDITGVVTVPVEGAAAPFTSLVGNYIPVLVDNFESDLGWTVYSAAGMISGPWARAIPGGWADHSPPADYDGSGKCYVTDNRNGYDVDLGPTQLTSPMLDLSATDGPIIRYAEWFYCDDATPPAQDFFDVHLSSDGGATWVLAAHNASHAGWVLREIAVADFIPLTATVQVRFTAVDNPNNSLTEAGVDAIEVFDVQCD